MVRNFPRSFQETLLVFSHGSRSEVTQRFCALQHLFFIILFFYNCIGKEVGSSIYTFGEKNPAVSRLPTAVVSFDLLQLPVADLIP